MKNVLIVLFVLMIFLFALFLVGCEETTFSGSKTNNDNQYLVDFDVLNTTLDGTMPLLKDDVVVTSIEIIKGNVDIIVVNEYGTIAYEGNDIKTCDLIIGIDESGTYAFRITGYKAKGSVYFEKE